MGGKRVKSWAPNIHVLSLPWLTQWRSFSMLKRPPGEKQKVKPTPKNYHLARKSISRLTFEK